MNNAVVLQVPVETIDYPIVATINNSYFEQGSSIICSGIQPIRVFGGGNSEINVINETESDICLSH